MKVAPVSLFIMLLAVSLSSYFLGKMDRTQENERQATAPVHSSSDSMHDSIHPNFTATKRITFDEKTKRDSIIEIYYFIWYDGSIIDFGLKSVGINSVKQTERELKVMADKKIELFSKIEHDR